MIKRNKKNIGVLVRVVGPCREFENRIGKVSSFRGDYKKGVPFVQVDILNGMGKGIGTYPFRGDFLERVK